MIIIKITDFKLDIIILRYFLLENIGQ